MLKPLLFLAAIAFWATMLAVFQRTKSSMDELPPIASNGLSDVWFFYLPLLMVTMCVVYFFTRTRERPTWKNFAINEITLKRDLAIAIAYLTISHLLVGGLFDIGLHFPGPEVFESSTHGVQQVIWWITIQGLLFGVLPYLWLRRQGFSIRKLVSGIDWKRDGWLMLAFWFGEFISVAFISDFFKLSPSEYAYAIPMGVFVNTIGAGLPVLIMIHLIIIPRLSLLLNNQFLVILYGGMIYALFSLFDPGVNYTNSQAGLASLSYIFATQTLIGMGKATFTVRTGNPFIHFTSFHILGARVAFDTAMYAEIFRR